jgi:hypothetical protein
MVAVPRGFLQLWNYVIIPWGNALEELNWHIWKIKQKHKFSREQAHTHKLIISIHKPFIDT